MIIAIVGRLDKQGNDAFFHFLHNIDKRVSERSTLIDWAFSQKFDFVTASIQFVGSKIRHVWAASSQLGANLTKDWVFAFVVFISFFLELESLSTIDSYFRIVAIWNIGKLCVNNLIYHRWDYQILGGKMCMGNWALYIAIIDTDIFYATIESFAKLE